MDLSGCSCLLQEGYQEGSGGLGDNVQAAGNGSKAALYQVISSEPTLGTECSLTVCVHGVNKLQACPRLCSPLSRSHRGALFYPGRQRAAVVSYIREGVVFELPTYLSAAISHRPFSPAVIGRPVCFLPQGRIH